MNIARLDQLVMQTIQNIKENVPFIWQGIPDVWEKYGLTILNHSLIFEPEELVRTIKSHWLVFWYAEKHNLGNIETRYFNVLTLAENESGIKV